MARSARSCHVANPEATAPHTSDITRSIETFPLPSTQRNKLSGIKSKIPNPIETATFPSHSDHPQGLPSPIPKPRGIVGRPTDSSPPMWNQPFGKNGDVESGARPLYPMMLESPELRWGFIRKVYSIVALQLLLTIAVAAVVVTVRPIATFFVTTTAGLALYIVLIIIPFIILCPLYYYHQRHPVNYLLLGIFTVTLAFAIGLTCAFTSGKVILEAVILTAAVVVGLTLYTFWAAKRGQDFNFLGPFLFGALIVLMVFALIQILFPLGKISVMIYGCLAAIIFCGYIVYDTDNLIKRFTYDEYIWAAVSLYLDIVNLFLALLTVFRAADS
ncbi:protein LIFEGUARD 2-like [Punica granatum]|nr:protein LIFEGUARD 2-like [Punica granatum]